MTVKVIKYSVVLLLGVKIQMKQFEKISSSKLVTTLLFAPCNGELFTMLHIKPSQAQRFGNRWFLIWTENSVSFPAGLSSLK